MVKFSISKLLPVLTFTEHYNLQCYKNPNLQPLANIQLHNQVIFWVEPTNHSTSYQRCLHHNELGRIIFVYECLQGYITTMGRSADPKSVTAVQEYAQIVSYNNSFSCLQRHITAIGDQLI